MHRTQEYSIVPLGATTQVGMDAEYIHDSFNRDKKIVNISESKSSKLWRDVKIQPEFQHDFASVCSDFIKYGRGKGKAGKEVIQKLKKYLLFIGWKIEFRSDDVMRFRYLSPGGKLYYSLYQVCSFLMLTEHEDTISEIDTEKVCTDISVSSSTIDSKCFMDLDIPLDGKAIIEYVERIEMQGKKDKTLTENAKKYLKQCGWDLYMKQKKTKQELVYSSPNGKNYYSLYRACKSFCAEQPSKAIVTSKIIMKQVQLNETSSEFKKEGRPNNASLYTAYKAFGVEQHSNTAITSKKIMKKYQINEAPSEIKKKVGPKTKSNKRKRKSNHMSHIRLKRDYSNYVGDFTCSICCDGGNILLCDHCPSAFHLECIGLKEIPEGSWYCPSCKCHLCGESEFSYDAEELLEKSILYCDQCERGYHVGCFRENEPSMPSTSSSTGSWFCSKGCSKINNYLEQKLGKPNHTSENGITWTILRSNRRDEDNFDVETIAEYHSKLNVALEVLHQCFETIIEPRTQSDVVSDMLFNRASELRRLNFWGVYTVILEKNDEIISVATLRVLGNCVAEMPLIGTRFKHREMGMCRLLVTEIEKMLTEVGVEMFVLPAAPSLLTTWIDSFKFIQMNISDRMNLLGFNLLNFSDAIMCCKHLNSSSLSCVSKENDEHHQSSANSCASKSDEEILTFSHYKAMDHQLYPRKLMHVCSTPVQNSNVKILSNDSEESKGCQQSSADVCTDNFYEKYVASRSIENNNQVNVAFSFLTSLCS